MIEKLIFVLVGVFISALGYLIKRKIEKRPEIEALDKHKKLLDIHKQMNDQGISIDGVRQLEKSITGKDLAIKENTVELQSEAPPLLLPEETEDLTQRELNMRADERLKVAKEKLQQVLLELVKRTDESMISQLSEVQNSWVQYSNTQAGVAAASYRGGSVYPLIYLSELESLTNERTARLLAELDELVRLGN